MTTIKFIKKNETTEPKCKKYFGSYQLQIGELIEFGGIYYEVKRIHHTMESFHDSGIKIKETVIICHDNI